MCPKNPWPCGILFLYPSPPCRSNGSKGLGREERREAERQKGDLELKLSYQEGPCIPCGFPSSLNTALLLVELLEGYHKLELLFAAVSGRTCVQGWLEVPRRVGAGLTPSSSWDEAMGTFLWKAQQQTGLILLSYWGVWHTRTLSLAQRTQISVLCCPRGTTTLTGGTGHAISWMVLFGDTGMIPPGVAGDEIK